MSGLTKGRGSPRAKNFETDYWGYSFARGHSPRSWPAGSSDWIVRSHQRSQPGGTWSGFCLRAVCHGCEIGAARRYLFFCQDNTDEQTSLRRLRRSLVRHAARIAVSNISAFVLSCKMRRQTTVTPFYRRPCEAGAQRPLAVVVVEGV